jgi:hypothetical protein
MNDYYAANNDQVIGPMDETQTEVDRPEENIAMQNEQAITPEVVESGQLPWLKDEEIDELQARWDSIQIEFVDEPRVSVEKADALLADALERIKQMFSNEQTTLNEQWVSREDISTEDLRVALQNYRSFLNRLLEL